MKWDRSDALSHFIEEYRHEKEVHEYISTFGEDWVLTTTRLQGRS